MKCPVCKDIDLVMSEEVVLKSTTAQNAVVCGLIEVSLIKLLSVHQTICHSSKAGSMKNQEGRNMKSQNMKIKNIMMMITTNTVIIQNIKNAVF